MARQVEQEYEEFAYVVSHDLNAPLRQIDSFVKLLADDLGNDLSEDQLLYKRMINEAVREAQTSLEGLLAFSRLNTEGKEMVPVSLEDLFTDVLNDLAGRIAWKHAEIHIEDVPQIIQGDYKTLKRAFTEIIDNALKFQPEGQKPVIIISGRTKNNHTIITIKDNGIGIAPRNHRKIFTILRRLHNANDYEGQGVGLTLAKKIAEIHGGYLDVESQKGGGAVFHFAVSESIMVEEDLP